MGFIIGSFGGGVGSFGGGVGSFGGGDFPFSKIILSPRGLGVLMSNSSIPFSEKYAIKVD